MELIEQRIADSYLWAWHYANSCTTGFSNQFEREELRSVGILGYVVAASRYDENKGSSFRSFCAARIRGAIVDEVRRSSWEPRSARRTHQLLAGTKLALDAELQRNATDAELAQALGMDESDLARLRELSQPARCISLDDDSATGSDNEALPLKETLADRCAVAPSAAIDTAEIRHALFTGISKLPPSEASVIILFYLRGTPFRSIARMMNLTPARISQRHRQGLASLRKFLAQEPGKSLFASPPRQPSDAT
jgi:RNA polymerase sigma factor for flagellar operon FliA